MKKYRNDFILIGFIIVVAIVCLFIYNNGSQNGDYVVVRVNGEEVNRYSLSQDNTYKLNGGSNILVIENNCAYLIDANCPDKLCVKQGKIKHINQCITCLPNKLTVSIEGDDEGADFVN